MWGCAEADQAGPVSAGNQWAAYRRVDRLQTQISGNAPGIDGHAGATVVPEELKLVTIRNGLDLTKALLCSLDEDLAHGLT